MTQFTPITIPMLADLKPGDDIAMVTLPEDPEDAPVYEDARVLVNANCQMLIERRPDNRPKKLVRWSKTTNKPVGNKGSRTCLCTVKERTYV